MGDIGCPSFVVGRLQPRSSLPTTAPSLPSLYLRRSSLHPRIAFSGRHPSFVRHLDSITPAAVQCARASSGRISRASTSSEGCYHRHRHLKSRVKSAASSKPHRRRRRRRHIQSIIGSIRSSSSPALVRSPTLQPARNVERHTHTLRMLHTPRIPDVLAVAVHCLLLL